MEPHDLAVLCGRSSGSSSSSNNYNNSSRKVASQHPGNARLLQKIKSCLDQYERSQSQVERMEINRHVINYMQTECGARFLKPATTRDGSGGGEDGSGEGWVPADDLTIRSKIRNAFRHLSKKKEKMAKESQQQQERRDNEKISITMEAFHQSQRPVFISNLAAKQPDENDGFIQRVHLVYQRQQEILDAMICQQENGRDRENN